ncbi:glutathione S-transferase family protein [uncultured Cohaesibacter sp.]|uniref:glutathione S-transferase family protein n=1 Tax=uncultured Cohaesibacter sp. TaxID=1002546 RepID=UPI0029C68437|nr:glutathione S-transferase family protein [uncultured Cohaesibacter sp.]
MTIKMYDLCAADRNVRFSPACWRTRMALAHKGLAVETVPTLFTEIGSIEGGGQKTVPVINDDGVVIRDSFAIALHLEVKYPDLPSLFAGPSGMALCRFVHYWADGFINGQIARMCIFDIHQKLDEKDKAYFRQSREARFKLALEEAQDQSPERLAAFRQSLTPLRLTLYKQPYFGGERPHYADYCLFGSLQWARMVSDLALLEKDDPVRDWFERCLDLFAALGRNAKV